MEGCGGCVRSGHCCNPLEMPVPEVLAAMNLRPADRWFVTTVVKRITKEEALRRNPYLAEKYKERGTKVMGNYIEGSMRYTWYECPFYDEEGRKCRVHGTALKPPVCVEYPRLPKMTTSFHPECGFRNGNNGGAECPTQ